MGESGVPTPAQIIEAFALARAIVLADQDDEEWPEPFGMLEGDPAAHARPAAFALAQLVVLLAGGLAPLADAIETMSSRPPSRGRLAAACAVAREWFRATEDNSAEAMRLIAKLARKEPS